MKEKNGKWKLFKRWKKRYFTLSGDHITYQKTGVSLSHGSAIPCIETEFNWPCYLIKHFGKIRGSNGKLYEKNLAKCTCEDRSAESAYEQNCRRLIPNDS